MDTEANGQEAVAANGDDLNPVGTDDEDGVLRTAGWNWSVATGGKVDITANGCATVCYVSAWIDWGKDGSFYDPYDRVLLDYPVSGTLLGTATANITVPAGTVFGGNPFNVRFRLYSSSTNGAAQPTGYAADGEVEDHQWQFGPTAVEVVELSASARPGNLSALAWLGAAALLSAGSLLAYKTWRKRA